MGLTALAAAHADVLDEASALQSSVNAALIDAVGGRWTGRNATDLDNAAARFSEALTTSRDLWPSKGGASDDVSGARAAAVLQARLQHVAAIEMLAALDHGDVERAREWRAIIALPKFASALEGALALQQLGGKTTQRGEVSRLLAREYVLWQITRAREKADEVVRLVAAGRQTPTLLAARVSEVEELSQFPDSLHKALNLTPPAMPESRVADIFSARDPAPLLAQWRIQLAAVYPNLLTPDDIASRERIVLKLLRLIPIEYQSGVRDGEVVIPIEYREAVNFTIHARRILAELVPVWQQARSQTVAGSAAKLTALLDGLEQAIATKQPLSRIRELGAEISGVLQSDFGLTLKRTGAGGDAAVEAALEVRSLLGQSLSAALAGKWRQAEALRLEAYINFDLDIEMRVLPREPSLAIRAEKAFLDGGGSQPGIKSALDARLDSAGLQAAYQRALALMDESVALCRVGLAPGAATVSATLIVLREGLEAVVILAALLAGLRGAGNAPIRRRIGVGAWLALAASAALFAVSRTLLAGLSRYGELLEAVISLLAVAILLMVTNWVFHKYYWTGWNARLRQLSKAAAKPKAPWLESVALVGVGFMTIFREGFETTLFVYVSGAWLWVRASSHATRSGGESPPATRQPSGRSTRSDPSTVSIPDPEGARRFGGAGRPCSQADRGLCAPWK